MYMGANWTKVLEIAGNKLFREVRSFTRKSSVYAVELTRKGHELRTGGAGRRFDTCAAGDDCQRDHLAFDAGRFDAEVGGTGGRG